MGLSSNQTVLIAEMRLINALYLSPQLLLEQPTSEELFIHDISKSLYKAVVELINEKIPLTEGAVFERFSAIDTNATYDLLTKVIEFNTSPIETLRDIVADLASAKAGIEAVIELEKVTSIVGNNFRKSPEDVLKIRDSLYQAEHLLLSNTQQMGVDTLEQWHKKYLENFDHRRHGKRWLFGEKDLDDIITNGAEPGGGGLIVASTGAGKSSFLLHLANNFINADIPCMFFELEMSGISCMDRLLSMRLKIPHKELVNPPSVSDFDSNKQMLIEKEKELIEHKNFRFCENPSVYLHDIRSHIKKFLTEINSNYCIVLVDLMSMVKDFCIVKPGLSLAGTMEMAINQMNEIAKELNIHYIGSVQLNRSIEQDKLKDVDDIDLYKPKRAAVKNSGAMLERARYCLSLFRKRYYVDLYFPDFSETVPDKVEVRLLKQNDGAVSGYNMLFDPTTFSMLHYDDQEMEEIENE